MRLALALGWSVSDIRRYMTAGEVQMWKAYAQIEPFGEERADLRAAIVAHTVASCMSGSRSKIADFMPDFDRKDKRQSVQEMQNMLAPILTKKEKET